jgi:hypothetical protein
MLEGWQRSCFGSSMATVRDSWRNARLRARCRMRYAPSLLIFSTKVSLIYLDILLRSGRVLVDLDFASFARYRPMPLAPGDLFDLAFQIRDQHMASCRACHADSCRAGTASTNAVKVRARERSSSVRNEETGLLDGIYDGQVSLPSHW